MKLRIYRIALSAVCLVAMIEAAGAPRKWS